MAAAADALRIQFAERIAAHDRPGAVSVTLGAVASGAIAIPDLYDMLAAVLTGIGDSWQIGETEVWEEHYATACVRTIVEACQPLVIERATRPIGRSVVLATPPEEYHDLGLRMLADRFTLAGWTAHLLGASVPADQLVAAARHLSADGVALSVYTHFHRVALKPYVDEIRTALPGLRVWVGGAAFAFEHDGWPDEMVLQPGSVPRLAESAF